MNHKAIAKPFDRPRSAPAHRVARSPRVLGSGLVLALLVPWLAAAQQPAAPFDSPMPLTTPVPTAALVLSVEGGTYQARTVGKKPLVIGLSDAPTIQGQTPDPTMGPFLHFSDTADTRLSYDLTDITPFGTTAKLGAAPATSAGADGVTVALWFRFNTAEPVGLVPIFSKGYCVSALDGSLAVHECGEMPLPNRVSQLAITDTLWHHLALRVSSYSVDLFVDGQSAVQFVAAKPLSWLQSEAMRITRFGTQPVFPEGPRKSPTDIAKIYVFHLPLNVSDIQAIRASATAGLVFQWPSLDPDMLGFVPATASARPRKPNGLAQEFPFTLPVRPKSPGSQAEVDLLRYRGALQVNSPLFYQIGTGSGALPPASEADALRDVPGVTAAAWVRWPASVGSEGKLALRWRPSGAVGAGWSATMSETADSKANLVFSCGNGKTASFDIGRTDSVESSADVRNRWHLLVVRPIDAENVEVHLNQLLLGKVAGCAGYAALVAFSPTTPALTIANDVDAPYAALFRGRTPLSTIAQYMAPGPTVYSAALRATDTTDDWTAAAASDTAAVGAQTPADGEFGGTSGRISRSFSSGPGYLNWLSLDSANPSFTVSMNLRTNAFLDGKAVLARRTFVGTSADGQATIGHDVQLLFECVTVKGQKKCTMTVETPTTTEYEVAAPAVSELYDNFFISYRRGHKVSFLFESGKTYRLTVAWPYVHKNYDDGTKPDVLEPAVFIDGVLQNATKNLQVVPTLPASGVDRTQPKQLAFWMLGAGTSSGDIQFNASDVRFYSRAVLEAGSMGMGCNGPGKGKSCSDSYLSTSQAPPTLYTSPTCTCGYCDTSLSYRVAAAGVSGEECRVKLPVYGDCATDEQCKSGVCSRKGDAPGVCVFGSKDKATCDYDCAYRGRQCVASGQGWICGDCTPGFVLEPGKANFEVTSADRNCAYRPTKKSGEECKYDAECLSGMCKDTVLKTTTRVVGGAITTYQDYGWDNKNCCSSQLKCHFNAKGYTNTSSSADRFEVKDVVAKACMAQTRDECETQGVPAGPPLAVTPQVVQPVVGTTANEQKPVAFECKFGGSDPCLPGDVRRARILKPEACYKMLSMKADDPTRPLQNWIKEGGRCKFSNNGWLGALTCGCDVGQHSYPEETRRYKLLKRPGLDLDPAELKFLILNDTSDYVQSDYGRLLAAGVGSLLFDYAVADAEGKQAMVEQYGAFQPIGACDAAIASLFEVNADQMAYWKNNDIACQPDAQDNGAVCGPPPTSTLAKSLAGSPKGSPQWAAARLTTPWQEISRKYCKSYYCNRVTEKCDDGDNPLEEIRLSKDGENVKREGSQGTQFGIVRMDYMNVKYSAKTCDEGKLVDPATGKCAAGVTPETPSRWGQLDTNTSNKYSLVLFGQAILTVLGVENETTVDTVGAEPGAAPDRCATGSGTMTLLGYDFDAADPPGAGACNTEGEEQGDASWIVCGKGCPAEKEELGLAYKAKRMQTIQSFTVTGLKIPGSAEDEDEGQVFCLPTEKFLKKNKTKQFTIGGIVPAYVSGTASVSVCVNLQHVFANDGFPALRVEPTIALEGEAKVALGVNSKGIELPDPYQPVDIMTTLDPKNWSGLTKEQKDKKKADEKAEKEKVKKMSKAEKAAHKKEVAKKKKAKKKGDEKFEAGIGLKLDLIIFKLGFPIVQGTTASGTKNASGSRVPHIFDVRVYEKVLFRLSVFGGTLSLWGGLAVGPFKLELVVPIFSWRMWRWEWEISKKELLSVVVDFLAKFPHPNKVPQLPVCDESKSSNPCNAP